MLNSGRVRSKVTSPVLFSDFSGWDEDTSQDISILPLMSVKSPHMHKKSEGLKELIRIPQKHKSSNTNNLPVVVSAYENSKFHPKLKDIFDQPLRTSRVKVKFPAINTKSVFSVYLTSAMKRRHFDNKNSLDKKGKASEIIKIRDKGLDIQIIEKFKEANY
ncbi:hypothetical protein SteCoe_10950 [Stentor coeruleus]|uniref:Uncharacterized protein n=1 Tax=Stentor coeruleus TaxID=5963 RepID=A0A1R2CEH0_9CILI|nr:hypothetical protein SteCoe_10950 [Stentor coeruleus]